MAPMSRGLFHHFRKPSVAYSSLRRGIDDFFADRIKYLLVQNQKFPGDVAHANKRVDDMSAEVRGHIVDAVRADAWPVDGPVAEITDHPSWSGSICERTKKYCIKIGFTYLKYKVAPRCRLSAQWVAL